MKIEYFLLLMTSVGTAFIFFVYKTLSAWNTDKKEISAESKLKEIYEESSIDVSKLTVDERIAYTNYKYGSGAKPDFLK